MANVIKLKRGSGSDPGSSDLVIGEIALRTDTGKIFTKKDDGSIAEISGSGGGGNNFKINTISSSSESGGGSASFNDTAYRFTLSDPPSTSAAQCLVSVNGVIQKPVAGSSQPAEGFSISGNDILFSSAPATNASYFIITYDSLAATSVSDDSIDEANLKISNAGSNGEFLQKQSGNTGGLTWASVSSYTHPNHSGEVTSSGDGATTIADNVVDEANLKVSNSPTNGYFLSAQSGNTGGLTWAAVDSSTLKHSGNTKAEATAWGTEFTGDLIVPDVISHLGDTDTRIRFSSTDQFDIEIAGTRRLRANSSGIDVTGTCTATTFSGSGASLTSLAANQLSSGTVATARLGSGTASSSTYLRGDNTWASISAGTTVNNHTTNRLLTCASTSGQLDAESKLTFDSNTLHCEGAVSLTHDSNDQVNLNSTSAWCVARFQVSGTNRGYVSVGSDTVYLGNSTDGSAIKLKGSSFQFTPDDSNWYDILTSNSTIVATSLATTGATAPINITTTGASSPINIDTEGGAGAPINIRSKGTITLAAEAWAYGIALNCSATAQTIVLKSTGATDIDSNANSGHAINIKSGHALNLESVHATNIEAAHGMTLEAGHNLHIKTGSSYPVTCFTNFVPDTTNDSDLGTSSLRWKNLYINDLQLSNQGSQNDVDGTWGDWTLQEGEDSIFMINNRTGKKYRMALQEVS